MSETTAYTDFRLHANHDATCVMHLHTEAQMALSTLPEGLLPLTQHAMRLYGRISYHDYEGIALSGGERARLIADLGDSAAMILHNHGSLTIGATVAQAFVEMFYLEKGGPQPVAGPGHRAASDHPAAGHHRADRAPVGEPARLGSRMASPATPAGAGGRARLRPVTGSPAAAEERG
jgi:hypothetical protein